VSLIQKDVSFTTVDAMKRTISGMLGLLPSDQFQVLIEALWEPLSKLLISSMMTGYTLRNAEYRLCLERNLDICEGDKDKHKSPDKNSRIKRSSREELSDKISDIHGLKDLTPEARQYIIKLCLRLASTKKELGEAKRKTAALEMQQFVGEEKNDLLDYLRSLQPEKVVELSEPSSPELKEVMHSVVHGLLATLSPKMHSMAPPHTNSNNNNTVNTGTEDKGDVMENTSLNFHPLVSLSRDYLARLLFWCMLLGHYVRGLEYRMELTELLSLPNDEQNNDDGQQYA
jgi:hypothetical protein